MHGIARILYFAKENNVWVCLCNDVISRLTQYLINLTVAEFMPQIHGVSNDDYINAVFLPVSVTSFFFVCV